jgi:hypothetical protein
MKTCDSCAHYSAVLNPPGFGDCYRYPPVPLPDGKGGVIWVVPRVHPGWHCGEHQQRPVVLSS